MDGGNVEPRQIDESNPLIQQMLGEGTQIANPAYNPKKKGKKANLGIPPTIYDKTPQPVGGSIWDGIADNAQDLKYNNTDLGLSVDQVKNYEKYGANPGPYSTQKELNDTRANNQSALEQTGHSLAQMVGNEFVLGTALGLSNLVDMAVNIGKDAGENDYTSTVSSFLEQKQAEVKDRFDIYRKDPNDKFALGDYGWWADNAVSVASTLSLLIPSAAITEGLSLAAKLGKLDRVSMGIAKAAKAGNFTKGAYTLSKAINAGTEIGTAALLSRTMENYQEARGVYKEVNDKYTDKFKTMSADDRAELYKNNPDFVGMSDKDIVAKMSGLSADETFRNDYAMLIMDMVQFKALCSMWKGVVAKESTSALRVANRAAIDGLVEGAEVASEPLSFFGKRKEILKHALQHPLTSIEAIQLSEGFEEGFQGVQTEKGKEVADKIYDPHMNPRTLGSYLTDSSIWEQAFWGAAGGIAFQGAGTILGNASKSIKGKINKSKLSEQDYALSQMTDEKVRENEINSRKTRLQDYRNGMQLLNEGKNPFGYKLDPDTKQPVLVDGSKVNQDVTADESEMLKSKLTNDFVTNMVLDATDKGNFDLLKDYIKDPNFNKYFEDAGLKSTQGDRSFTQILTDKMDEVHEEYNGALYDITNSIDIKNENVAKAVARSIARRKLEMNDLQDVSNDLSGQIYNNADSESYSNYEEAERVRYVQDKLNEIADKETGIQKLLDNKRISPQAVEQISKENNLRRNQLLAFASSNNMFGNPEAIKRILSNNIESADTNEFIAEFNRFLNDAENPLFSSKADKGTETPKKSLQDIIKKKIALDDHVSYLDETLPKTQSQYQAEHDDIARAIDKLTIDRYNEAADVVSKYLEGESDLDVARDNIMTNNVPANIKDKLDILKLGHHTTQKFTAQINAVLNTLAGDREAAAQEARNITVDDTISNDDSAQDDILDLNTVDEQTDGSGEVIDDSSTGDLSETTKAEVATTEVTDPNIIAAQSFNVAEEVANIDKSNEAIEQQRAQDFLLDNDSRAVGLASSITFNLFRSSRNLFDNLEGKDVNSAEFNNLINEVANELINQGVSKSYSQKAALDGVKLSLSTIYRRLNSKGDKGADKFRRLADEIATKNRIETVVNNNTNVNKTQDILKSKDVKVGDRVIQGDKQGTITDKSGKAVTVTFDRGGKITIGNLDSGNIELLPINNENVTIKLTDTQLKDKIVKEVPYIRGFDNSNSLDYIMNYLQEAITELSKPGGDINSLREKQDAYNKAKSIIDSNNNQSGITTVSNSTTKLIPNNEFNQVIDEFINSYIENKGIYTLKGSKTIINVEDLFKELLNNKEISFEQAKHIFYNIADYISASNNGKYIFTNKTNLNKNLKTPTIFFNNLINNKEVIEIVDTHMHIAAPFKKEVTYNKEVANAVNGGDVTIGYYEGEYGVSNKSISIKSNGVEIGYLGSVTPNNTNTGYSLKTQNKGFVYTVTNNNNVIESNLDKLFIPLINKQTPEHSNLMDIAYKQYLYENAFNNDNTSPEISNNDVDNVLNNKVIKELLSKGELVIPVYIKTNRAQAEFIVNAIGNIVFYNANATTNSDILDSYSYWKSSIYSNYTNTYKLQQAIEKNKKVTTKLINATTGNVIINENNSDISNMGFTYERNPIMIVDLNGNIVNERNNTSYSNVAGFEPGTMGMLITDNPNAPIMALFTETNKLSTNSELSNRVTTELSGLFNNFQNKDINFDTLGKSLFNLLGGPRSKGDASDRTNLFSGYNVVRTSDKIALNLRGEKSKYTVIIHKFEKGTNKEGTGITFISNGDQTKAKSYITLDKNTNDILAKEIVDNLNFNKTFYTVNKKNVDNEKTNPYLYKENGKVVVEIGGKKDVYNSFGHFVLKNNTFKTNQGRNEQGGYFDVANKVKSLYINTAIVNSPVEESSIISSSTNASDLIKTVTKTKSVNTNELLDKAGVPKEQVTILTGDNQFNIELIPKETYFDNKAIKAEAYYSQGKMFFTNKGATNISKSPANLVRLLIHENLHAKFEEQSLFKRYGIVNDLLDTHQALLIAVNNDVNNEDKTSDRYKQALAIQKWLTDNKFNVDDYFTTLSVEQQRAWSKRTQEDKERQFAEEWLVESLTQPTIIRYLNSTIYNGDNIIVDNIDNNDKTIWQKIIDVLLKLFSRNSSNIKNNTILAQQYSILGNSTNDNIINNTVAEQTDNNDNPNEILLDDIETIQPNIDRDSKQINEQSDIDDLDFAVTDLIQDIDSINIDSYRQSNNVNMNGVQVIPDMNKYINQFNEQDKLIIAKMMAGNEVKFRCE